MCSECTFIEEDVPMIFDDDKTDTPEDLATPEYPNLIAERTCCGGSCCVGG